MSLRYTGGILSAGLNGINSPVTTVEYLVVAGGGGGGGQAGGGGGAGGLLTATGYPITTGSPIIITIGAGGAAANTSPYTGNNGIDSVFGSIRTSGGGGGAYYGNGPYSGGSGGGGGGGTATAANTGASGVPGQGFAGGNGDFNGARVGGGGGGAGGPGGNQEVNYKCGSGGPGVVSSITGSPVEYAGGGGGSSDGGITGYAKAITRGFASGGGGAGGMGRFGTTDDLLSYGEDAIQNTGGGGGAAGPGLSQGGDAGKGGSGIVVIRYPSYLTPAKSTTGSPATYVTGAWRVYKFIASGTITF